MAIKFPTTFHSPTEFTLAVLAGKWKTVILGHVMYSPRRYSELRRLVPDLSDKVLSERLRDLVSLGLVTHRKGDGQTSSDIYALAARGRSLTKILRLLYEWGTDNATDFHVKVGDPLEMLNRDKARR
jgi:DNA-binding HxlR family transcriptional regulator